MRAGAGAFDPLANLGEPFVKCHLGSLSALHVIPS